MLGKDAMATVKLGCNFVLNLHFNYSNLHSCELVGVLMKAASKSGYSTLSISIAEFLALLLVVGGLDF